MEGNGPKNRQRQGEGRGPKDRHRKRARTREPSQDMGCTSTIQYVVRDHTTGRTLGQETSQLNWREHQRGREVKDQRINASKEQEIAATLQRMLHAKLGSV